MTEGTSEGPVDDLAAIAEYQRRYRAAAHAMQSGVGYKMQHDIGDTTPKHLRVGVNSAMVEHAALVEMLVDKGILTWTDYYRALAEGMEAEKQRYQTWLNDFYDGRGGGVRVTLV